MNNWVALLRSVNLGGNNKVPMALFRAACAQAGLGNVETYIASGNLVFSTDANAMHDAVSLTDLLQNILRTKFDVVARVLVLHEDELKAALHACSWPDVEGKFVHAVFCFDPPEFDAVRYETLKTTAEALRVSNRLAWMHAPDGVGRSVLFAKLEQVLCRTDFTARNLNTVRKLVEMLDG